VHVSLRRGAGIAAPLDNVRVGDVEGGRRVVLLVEEDDALPLVVSGAENQVEEVIDLVVCVVRTGGDGLAEVKVAGYERCDLGVPGHDIPRVGVVGVVAGAGVVLPELHSAGSVVEGGTEYPYTCSKSALETLETDGSVFGLLWMMQIHSRV